MYESETPSAHNLVTSLSHSLIHSHTHARTHTHTHTLANWITNNKRKQSFKDNGTVIPTGFEMLSFTLMFRISLHQPRSLFNIHPVLYLTQQSSQLDIYSNHCQRTNHFIFYTFTKKFYNRCMTGIKETAIN